MQSMMMGVRNQTDTLPCEFCDVSPCDWSSVGRDIVIVIDDMCNTHSAASNSQKRYLLIVHMLR